MTMLPGFARRITRSLAAKEPEAPSQHQPPNPEAPPAPRMTRSRAGTKPGAPLEPHSTKHEAPPKLQAPTPKALPKVQPPNPEAPPAPMMTRSRGGTKPGAPLEPHSTKPEAPPKLQAPTPKAPPKPDNAILEAPLQPDRTNVEAPPQHQPPTPEALPPPDVQEKNKLILRAQAGTHPGAPPARRMTKSCVGTTPKAPRPRKITRSCAGTNPEAPPQPELQENTQLGAEACTNPEASPQPDRANSEASPKPDRANSEASPQPDQAESEAPPARKMTRSCPSTTPEAPPQPDRANPEDAPQPLPLNQEASNDEGKGRSRLRVPLRYVPEAFQAAGEDVGSTVPGSSSDGSLTKRKRKRGTDGPCGRGLAKIPDPIPSKSDRPQLVVVGDGEFSCTPHSTKVISTIRLLTLELMPGPLQTYNMFPVDARLAILQKFMQRYTWAADQDVGRCLDVFENIASDSYTAALSQHRKKCRAKFGNNKELWKGWQPLWCKNSAIWKGLCNIWNNDAWEKQSVTNRTNKTKGGHVVQHVAGSKSMYRHKMAMINERGSGVAIKDVFDRTHMRDTPGGRVYVNPKAEKIAGYFDILKAAYGSELEDEELWERAAEGEKRGRVYGFGYRSRISKANKSIGRSPTDPMKSTATSAETKKTAYSPSEVSEMLAAARKGFEAEIVAQEMRHKAEMEQLQKRDDYNKACIERLFEATGIAPPCGGEGSSRGSDGQTNKK